MPDPMEDQLLNEVPTWMKWLGGALAVISATALYLRQFLSNAKVDRTVDAASVSTIQRLQEQLILERDRADALMREREAMSREIGELSGEVKGLRDQVAMLTALVREMKGGE